MCTMKQSDQILSRRFLCSLVLLIKQQEVCAFSFLLLFFFFVAFLRVWVCNWAKTTSEDSHREEAALSRKALRDVSFLCVFFRQTDLCEAILNNYDLCCIFLNVVVFILLKKNAWDLLLHNHRGINYVIMNTVRCIYILEHKHLLILGNIWLLFIWYICIYAAVMQWATPALLLFSWRCFDWACFPSLMQMVISVFLNFKDALSSFFFFFSSSMKLLLSLVGRGWEGGRAGGLKCPVSLWLLKHSSCVSRLSPCEPFCTHPRGYYYLSMLNCFTFFMSNLDKSTPFTAGNAKVTALTPWLLVLQLKFASSHSFYFLLLHSLLLLCICICVFLWFKLFLQCCILKTFYVDLHLFQR